MIELKSIEKCFWLFFAITKYTVASKLMLQNNHANVSKVAFNKTFLFFEIGNRQLYEKVLEANV